MYYYDPNDRGPRRWAVTVTLLYAGLLVAAFVFVSFDFRRIVEKPGDTIEIEFVEPEPEPESAPESAPEPAPEVSPEPATRKTEDRVEQMAQEAGPQQTTRTPDPRSLFRMSGGTDEPEPAGNPHLREGDPSQSGRGAGGHAEGLDQLDRGLQGRGLVGALPRPAYPGRASGKVVIRVTVAPSGEVQGAAYEPQGSTTGDHALIEAALEAARKARFAESAAAVQGGTITYIFRME